MHHYPPAPKPGMSTGAKIALGCGVPILLGMALMGGCAVLAGTAVSEIDKEVKKDARAARQDVELVSCEITDEEFTGRDVKAKVKITNHGDKRANYIIEGEFLDQNDNQVDSLTATVSNLAPGKSTTQDFVGLFTSSQLEGVTKGSCKILDVTRDEFFAAN